MGRPAAAKRQVATSVMTQRPELAWYTLDAETSTPTRLVTDEGRPEPALTSKRSMNRVLELRAVS